MVGRMKPVVSLMDALDDAEEALLRAYLRSGWDDIRKALALIVRLKDSNTGRSQRVLCHFDEHGIVRRG